MGACCTKPVGQVPCQSARGGGEIARQGADSIVGADTKLESKLNKYTELGYLIAVLRTGAVRLVKAKYIVHQYLDTSDPMPCRQDLPEEAFLRIEDLTERELAELSVFALSYCWVTADHPDPDRYHLKDVALILNMYLRGYPDEILEEGERERGFEGGGMLRPVAVFWDWCALPQDKPKGRRTEEESVLFKQGLESVNTWYAHALTTVLALTTLPAEAARPSYEDSAWTSFERAVASIITPGPRLLVVGEEARAYLHHNFARGGHMIYHHFNKDRMDRARQAPLDPQAFSALIRKKHVTNGADVDEVLIPRYRQTFEEVIAAGTISLSNCDLTARAARETLRVARIHCPRLRQLSLGGNAKVDLSLAEVAASCRQLAHLDLAFCYAITGDLSSLSEETNLEVLNLFGCREVEGSLSSLESLERLQTLRLGCPRVGGGLASLMGLKQLRVLRLYDTACEGDLSELGGLQELTDLDLGTTSDSPLISGNVSSLAGLKQLLYLRLDGQKVKNDLTGSAGITHVDKEFDGRLDVESAYGCLSAYDFLSALKLADVEEAAAAAEEVEGK